MTKKQLILEEKRLDVDLMIIGITTFAIFGLYALFSKQLMSFVDNSNIHVIPRLLLNAFIQFGISGLGISIIMLIRREGFYKFGLIKKNALKSIIGTFICFTPLIAYIFSSGKFNGYKPLNILITDDVLSSDFPLNLLGMGLILLVWGFFEGFNYAVISEKINKRYPSRSVLLNYGAITCAIICLLFHPIRGIIDLITVFFAIYGMLVVKDITANAWGCVFAFCFIWNAL